EVELFGRAAVDRVRDLRGEREGAGRGRCAVDVPIGVEDQARGQRTRSHHPYIGRSPAGGLQSCGVRDSASGGRQDGRRGDGETTRHGEDEIGGHGGGGGIAGL